MNAREPYLSLGLLVLRVGAGGSMILLHGWGKLLNFGPRSATFYDPFGIGPAPSLALAVFAELFCSALIVTGLATRLAAIPLVITMWVAAFGRHAADPWSKKELAIVYSVAFLALVFTGPGVFSLDRVLGPFYRRFSKG